MSNPDRDEANLVAVTGASRGIGSAIARSLAGAGYRVACLTRKGMGVEDQNTDHLAQQLIPLRCDVTDDANVRAALAQAVHQAGPLYGLVNNAGVHADGDSHTFSTESFKRVLETNVAAIFACAREAYPHLRANQGGLIVNIGSYYDHVGVPRHAAYCASKAAIGAITRCLAVEWASESIRCIDVAPGFIATDLNAPYRASDSFNRYIAKTVPVGRPGTPEEVAALVRALFDAEIPYLTGSTVYVDGGHGITL